MPDCLILHMPRFGIERLYEKIFPNAELDITDVLEGGKETGFMGLGMSNT